MSQINPVHVSAFYFLKIYFNIIPQSTSMSSKRSPFLAFHHQNSVYTSLFPIYATCPALLILLELIIGMIVGEDTEHEAPRCIVFSTHLSPQNSYAEITTLAPYSQTPQPLLMPQCEWPSFPTVQTAGKVTVLYTMIFMFLDSIIEDKKFYNQR